MPKGGYREGGGRPKGSIANHTREAQAKMKRIVERVNEATDVLVSAQLSLAKGLNFLYRVEKDEKGKMSKPILVDTQAEIEAYLKGDYDTDENYYYISAERPDNKAIDSLLNRVHGTPKQSVELTGDPDKPLEINNSTDISVIAERVAEELRQQKTQ